jgi:hypothetical protein
VDFLVLQQAFSEGKPDRVVGPHDLDHFYVPFSPFLKGRDNSPLAAMLACFYGLAMNVNRSQFLGRRNTA